MEQNYLLSLEITFASWSKKMFLYISSFIEVEK